MCTPVEHRSPGGPADFGQPLKEREWLGIHTMLRGPEDHHNILTPVMQLSPIQHWLVLLASTSKHLSEPPLIVKPILKVQPPSSPPCLPPMGTACNQLAANPPRHRAQFQEIAMRRAGS